MTKQPGTFEEFLIDLVTLPKRKDSGGTWFQVEIAVIVTKRNIMLLENSAALTGFEDSFCTHIRKSSTPAFSWKSGILLIISQLSHTLDTVVYEISATILSW